MVIVNETCEFASVASAIKLTLILFSDGHSSYLSCELEGFVFLLTASRLASSEMIRLGRSSRSGPLQIMYQDGTFESNVSTRLFNSLAGQGSSILL